MKCEDIRISQRVKTTALLGSTSGMIIPQNLLENRRANASGIVYGHVPGHGGDVWYVIHDAPAGEVNFYIEDGEEKYKQEYVTAYCFDELEKENSNV